MEYLVSSNQTDEHVELRIQCIHRLFCTIPTPLAIPTALPSDNGTYHKMKPNSFSMKMRIFTEIIII